MKIITNQELPAEERAWEAKNGATRRTLVVINKLEKEIPADTPTECSLGFLDKGNHSFIFINPPTLKSKDNPKIVGLFLDSGCAYDVVEEYSPKGHTIFQNYSSGGYGNSCSQFGLYEVGTTIKVCSYKHRGDEPFFKLSKKGWEYLGVDIPLSCNEIQEVV